MIHCLLRHTAYSSPFSTFCAVTTVYDSQKPFTLEERDINSSNNNRASMCGVRQVHTAQSYRFYVNVGLGGWPVFLFLAMGKGLCRTRDYTSSNRSAGASYQRDTGGNETLGSIHRRSLGRQFLAERLLVTQRSATAPPSSTSLTARSV
jgi:hypothetical protein